MTDTRAVGQEIQDQVLEAARKGRQRVTSTVKTVTATANMIRPQLPSLPTVHIRLPKPAELREKAPAFISTLPNVEQIREKAPAFIAKLPNTDQIRETAAKFGRLPATHELRASAEDLTSQVVAAQRRMISQLRTITNPLAEQAAAAFAQAGRAAKSTVASVANRNGATPIAHPEPAKPTEAAKHASSDKPAKRQPAKQAAKSAAKPATTASRRTAAATGKSKTKPAAK